MSKGTLVYTNTAMTDYTSVNYVVGDVVAHRLDPTIRGIVGKIYPKLNSILLDTGHELCTVPATSYVKDVR